jgi:hypothetical protein
MYFFFFLDCHHTWTTCLLVTQIHSEGDTTTADNTSILPSKKRLTRVVNQPSTGVKKKLSKKERKRLEKVLDVKRKKAQVRKRNHFFFLFKSKHDFSSRLNYSTSWVKYKSPKMNWLCFIRLKISAARLNGTGAYLRNLDDFQLFFRTQFEPASNANSSAVGDLSLFSRKRRAQDATVVERWVVIF